MAFYASNFIYDGIMSSEYGLRITSTSDTDSTAGANVNLFTQELYRRPKILLLGVQQSPVLEIPFTINVENELSASEESVVSNWLFGGMNYKKLQVVQPDMQYVYYNCILKDKQTDRVGNIVRGYTGVISCDSPFAWEYPRTVTHTYDPMGYIADETIEIINTSGNADYTYPTITITMNVFGGDISIINTSESATREFALTGLLPNEVLTVNSDLQTITSTLSTNRLVDMENCDYTWVRYIKGINNMKVEGNISSISFTHQFAKKIS